MLDSLHNSLGALHGNYPRDLNSAINLYQAIPSDDACNKDLAKYKAHRNHVTDPFEDLPTVYGELKKCLDSHDYSMVLSIRGTWTINGKPKLDDKGTPIITSHALVPYKIEESPDGQSAKIYVYDSNYPYDPQNPDYSTKYVQVNLAPGTENVDNYDFLTDISAFRLLSLEAIKQSADIPHWVYDVESNAGHLLYTDSLGRKLGYDQGVLKDDIPGTSPIISSGGETGIDSTESYYVPDPSIKMELYGVNNGVSNVFMSTPNGLIVANVTVSPSSVDGFKILNNGTGVYFNSENDTAQSLGLMLDIETPDYAQIVNASLSQIETGGYVNLSNDNGTLILQNSGLPRTCNLSIQQVTSNQNSSISINNIAIEGDSTVYIKPSNWNDLTNSTATIDTVKNTQGTQVTSQGAALTIVKSAYSASYDSIGQTITYTYTVTNSGNGDISAPITVTDDKFGTVPIQSSGILSPGSSVTGTTTYKIIDADIDAGTVTNSASAKGLH